MLDIIFINGAPGIGKSTVSKLLSLKLDSPLFEFGWIPEFQNKGFERMDYHEEEAFSFENLCLVLHNYVRHGFKNILVTDLPVASIGQIESNFEDCNYKLVTLITKNEKTLSERILDETRSSGYRNVKDGIKINSDNQARELYKAETRIAVDGKMPEEVALEVENLLAQ